MGRQTVFAPATGQGPGGGAKRRAPPHDSNFTVSQGSRASLGGPERWPGPLCVYCKIMTENSLRHVKDINRQFKISQTNPCDSNVIFSQGSCASLGGPERCPRPSLGMLQGRGRATLLSRCHILSRRARHGCAIAAAAVAPARLQQYVHCHRAAAHAAAKPQLCSRLCSLLPDACHSCRAAMFASPGPLLSHHRLSTPRDAPPPRQQRDVAGPLAAAMPLAAIVVPRCPQLS